MSFFDVCDEVIFILVSLLVYYVSLPHHFFFLCEGLPADSLALDEQRIYWSNDDNSSVVFYALRNVSSSLSILNSSTSGSAIFTLSPGQQPLPQGGNAWYS